MKQVTIFIIDDSDIQEELLQRFSNENSDYNFVIRYWGPIRTIDSEEISPEEQYKKYKDDIQSLDESEFAIILLDLNFDEPFLSQEQINKQKQAFPQEDFEDKNLYIGLFLLLDLIEVMRCRFEILIASAHTSERFIELVKHCLVNYEIFKDSITIHNTMLRFKERGVIRFLGGSVANSERLLPRIYESIEFFSRDFNEISWFLSPPQFYGSIDRWFPNPDAHNYPKPGFISHLNAVKERYPRFGEDLTGDCAKALVYCSDPNLRITRISEATAHPVRIDCLRDFFGDGFKPEGLDERDLITFPVEPAFPFLVVLRDFLRCFQDNKDCVVLRLLKDEPGKDENTRYSVIALGIRQDFSIENWGLVKNTWVDYIRRATQQDIEITDHQGDKTKLFPRVITACVISRSTETEIEGLKKALVGLDTFIALPTLEKDFIGVSWESRIILSTRVK